MATERISNIPAGKDAIKGGIYFGSNLTPGGVFSNIPDSTEVRGDIDNTKIDFTLTLEQVKEILQQSAKTISDSTEDILSEKSINTFLTSYVQLLIDYEDLRNLVFFGSSYNELSYQINWCMENFPFKAYIGKPQSVGLSIYYLSGNITEISLRLEDVIFDGHLTYNMDGTTSWNNNYDIVDKNGTRYPMVEFHDNITRPILNPVDPNIFELTIDELKELKKDDVIQILRANVKIGEGTVTTIPNTVGGQTTFNINYNPIINQNGTNTSNPGVLNKIIDNNKTWTINEWAGKYIEITAGVGVGEKGVIDSNTDNTLLTSGLSTILNTTSSYIIYDMLDVTDVCLMPESILLFRVTGNIAISNLISYQQTPSILLVGLIISPKLQILSNFEINLDGLKKALLNVLNPTPWPREPITNNIIISGTEFNLWIESPANMFKGFNASDTDQISIVSEPTLDLNLVGALTADEEKTGQLLRRFVPHEIVNELNDADDRYFTRFILLAGKLFDTIKVYIDFIKYTHTLNYGEYNQLSPQFYKLYSEHFGFNILSEDSIDLAQSIIFKEPGLQYDLSLNPSLSDTLREKTLKDLLNEKLKRLLISLFYLYQTKGTQICINYLTNLLGSPEGLLFIEEYVYNYNSTTDVGKKGVDNDKVHTPDIELEIDTRYLANPADINDSINLPYVYKYKLSNKDIINLREISIGIDPVQAILQDIIKYGKLTSPYGYFGTGTFANLQREDDYYLLPLTFPDKYYGITVNYNIPRNGYIKGYGDNQDEVNMHLCGLFKSKQPIEYKTPITALFVGPISGLPGFQYYPITLTTHDIENYNPTSVYVYNTKTIVNRIYPVASYTHDSPIEGEMQIVINVPVPHYTGIVYTDGGVIIDTLFDVESTLAPISGGTKFNYYISPTYLTKEELPTPQKEKLIKYGGSSQAAFSMVGDPALVGSTLTVKIQSISLDLIIGETTWKTTLAQTVQDIVTSINETVPTNPAYPDFSASYVKTEEGYEITINLKPDSVLVEGRIYEISVLRNGSTDIWNIVMHKSQLEKYVSWYEAEEYLVTRLEGKDLVVRLKLKNENTLDIEQRVAIFQNYFDADGLNHQLKLKIRPEGCEIYKDYQFKDLIRWKILDVGYPQFNARNYPKELILEAEYEPMPIDMFAFPDDDPGMGSGSGADIPDWWDLFVGWPIGINMFIYKVSIFENLAINLNDPLEFGVDASGFEVEKWQFDFANQLLDETGVPLSDELYIPCTYIAPVPLPTGVDIDIAMFLDIYFATNADKIILTSKNLYKGKVNFIQKVANFFETSNGEQILTSNDLFLNNAYSPTHNIDYDYDTYKEIYTNYYTYAEQVFTFLNLLSFVELIEKKFKDLVLQFIPIVINLGKFGKVIKNDINKARYEYADFKCTGKYLASNAIAGFRVVAGDTTAPTTTIKLKTIRTNIESINVVSPAEIKLSTPHNFTTGNTLIVEEIQGITSINGTYTITVIDDYTFSLDGSTPSGTWVIGTGKVIKYQFDLGSYSWIGSNSYTAQQIADGINTLGIGIVTAANTNNYIKLIIDTEQYLTTYNQNINLETLEIVATLPNIVGNITQPIGGQIATLGNDCIKVGYSVPEIIVTNDGLYIYFEEEEANPLYIFYEDEGSPPLYID